MEKSEKGVYHSINFS